MRIAVSINGQPKVTASLEGSGLLGAHLNVRIGGEESGRRTLKLIAHDHSNPPHSTVSEWPILDVAVGDTVELAVLEAGVADVPETRRSRSEPNGLLASADLAARVATEAQQFRQRLEDLIHQVQASETSEEVSSFKHAAGSVIYEIYERLLTPIWRRHQHLIPEELKGQPL